jgi:hypothetical protein
MVTNKSQEKNPLEWNSNGFLYVSYYRELIQHHNKLQRNSLYFSSNFIYSLVAGNT